MKITVETIVSRGEPDSAALGMLPDGSAVVYLLRCGSQQITVAMTPEEAIRDANGLIYLATGIRVAKGVGAPSPIVGVNGSPLVPGGRG